MIVYFLILSVPLATYFALPILLHHYGAEKPGHKYFLLLAGVAYAISWFVPNFLIDGRDTSFNTHMIGGGVYSGLVWAHIIHQTKSKLPVSLKLIGLFALVSMLGALNELLELLLVEVFDIRINSFDVWWDILANTVGAGAFWLIYMGLPTKYVK